MISKETVIRSSPFLLYKSLKIVVFCDILCLHSEYKLRGGRANVESVQG